MIPTPLEYRAPESLEEALALLSKYREDARVLSGGQDLIPALKLRLDSPAVLIDLRRIPALGAIEADGEGLRIGALATHAEIASSPLVRARAPVLAEAAAGIGDAEVRNWGTLGGSLSRADPAADYPASLLVLEAEVVIASPRGERSIPVADFLQGPFAAALEPDEVVRAVKIPYASPVTCAYLKMRRSSSGFAIAGAAARLGLEGSRAVEVAVAVTGVAGRPFRAHAAEDSLRGEELSAAAVEAAVQGIARGREVLSDIHASAGYRAHLAEVYAARAILLAASRA